jgi:hypothetical protein
MVMPTENYTFLVLVLATSTFSLVLGTHEEDVVSRDNIPQSLPGSELDRLPKRRKFLRTKRPGKG